MISDDTLTILTALKFSADKHRNQRRKDREASPYINHPIDVAVTLLHLGEVKEADVIVAAILHDTIEDTDTKPDEIASLFGQNVLSLVMEVTDDKELDKKVRKQLQVETAAKKSIGAKQIKLADKISNLRDIIYSPPANWSIERKNEYVEWSERVVSGLRGVNPLLEKLFDDTLMEAKKKLAEEKLRSGS